MILYNQLFSRYDGELHPECDNEKYLDYKTFKTALSTEICAYGTKLINGSSYEWLRKDNFK